MSSPALAQSVVATPELSPGSGTYPRVGVLVTCATPGATIRYTFDGSDPTESSEPPVTSGTVLMLNKALVLKVKAWKPGYAPSEIARADYVVTGGLAIGGAHVLVSKGNGSLHAWGANASGQLGCGTSCGSSDVPRFVNVVSDVVAVAAGGNHSLAVNSWGQVWAWGENGSGQVGDGTSQDRFEPVLVWDPPVGSPELEIVAVAAGAEHSLALGRDGKIRAWGNNTSGRLGDGTETQRLAPVDTAVFTTGVARIAAGGSFSMALKSDGTTWSWGLGSSGQLGLGPCPPDPAPCEQLTPEQSGFSGAVSIAAGDAFSLALKVEPPSTRVWSSGRNDSGQLGIGVEGAPVFTPVSGPAGPVGIAAGATHALALMPDGKLRAWGSNVSGELGDGSVYERHAPVWVLGTADAVVIAAGSSRSGFIGADGSVYHWGAEELLPVVVADFKAAHNVAWMTGDADADGLYTAAEYRAGSDPLNADTNGDGLSDAAAVATNQSPTSSDTDSDGLSNAAEILAGTDPLRPDTDGDGVADGADAYPMDPARSELPASNPSDTTPPTIEIVQPLGAIPVP